ncbi:hypothetical protein F5Y12DRAFT_791040 [Xylaria sp. FL1777]|nr:hypothetical protein F5Y12DRAFT_791040 [Xylaria sp. FL1777]
MASESHDGTAEANEPSSSDNNNNVVVSSGSDGAAGSSLKQFTPFQRLPPEVRIKIWKFAMEERRLVHLHPSFRSTLPEEFLLGCPKNTKPELKIYGVLYEQVPAYFFVNHECRHLALKHYSVRFLFAHPYLIRPGDMVPIVSNIIMSPDDILVCWGMNYENRTLLFGPQARLVRNLMACPWLYHPRMMKANHNVNATLEILVEKLGNEDVIKKLFFLGTQPSTHDVLTYRDPCTRHISTTYYDKYSIASWTSRWPVGTVQAPGIIRLEHWIMKQEPRYLFIEV